MSKKKALGSSKNNRDSIGKRLGVKVYGGQLIKTGGVIVRQRGMTKIAGAGAETGKDFTIFATRDGVVQFKKRKVNRFSGHRVSRVEVTVE